MDNPDAFPLQWPIHVRRTPEAERSWGGFQVTPDRATRDLRDEVTRSGGTDLVISTNRPVRKDGLPMASAREPDDPGVAVYFKRKGRMICVPCDTYDKVWKNIRAIGLSIKDMRGPEGRGCAQITDQAFTGFTALPPPSAAPIEMPGPGELPKPWYQVLGVTEDAPWPDIRTAYREKMRDADDAMKLALNLAYAAAKDAAGGE